MAVTVQECRHCAEPLRGDLLRLGARCPRCREPLYERTDGARRQREGREESPGACAVHPGNIAVGTCPRCGTYMCGLCRSRWQERPLCLACIERLLGDAQSVSEEAATHRRQAALSLFLGAVGWVLTLFVFIARGVGSGREALVLCMVVAAASYVPTLLGIGMAAAALRVRGDRMVAATWGLVLCGTQLGTVTGLLLLAISQQ